MPLGAIDERVPSSHSDQSDSGNNGVRRTKNPEAMCSGSLIWLDTAVDGEFGDALRKALDTGEEKPKLPVQ